MKITVRHKTNPMRWQTQRLLKRMLSPLCGIVQHIGLVSRARNEPRIFTAGVDLSGIHVLNNTPRPTQGAYHIGGSGICLDEAIIRALGESVERYAQLTAELQNRSPTCFDHYLNMLTRKEDILSVDQLRFFSEQQYGRNDFPFKPFRMDQPYKWIQATSLISAKKIWIPMQLLFVGYSIKHSQGEKWLTSAVTTGTAAHTDPILALRSALLELIQIDAAMGHWYASQKSYEIVFDSRTEIFEKLITQYSIDNQSKPKFFWLPSPDLKGMVIACIVHKPIPPYVAIGLGADTCLLSAMYKAYLEALSVNQLAKIILLKEKIHKLPSKDPGQIHDLDNNVAYYANHKNNSYIQENFLDSEKISANELPVDNHCPPKEQVQALIKDFRLTGKELVYVDLTTAEADKLGFTIARVWSPELLSLAIPSFVPKEHKRFQIYGGVKHESPHPYP